MRNVIFYAIRLMEAGGRLKQREATIEKESYNYYIPDLGEWKEA